MELAGDRAAGRRRQVGSALDRCSIEIGLLNHSVTGEPEGTCNATACPPSRAVSAEKYTPSHHGSSHQNAKSLVTDGPMTGVACPSLAETRNMPVLPFTKLHGAGNDFLVVEQRDLDGLGLPPAETPDLARRICSRQFGVGADGLEVVGPSEHKGALARAHLWNSDGSEAEISGNGTRCVAAYLASRCSVPERFLIETGAGPREVETVRSDSPDFEFRMTSDSRSCRVVESSLWLNAGGARRLVTTVDVGNPQCVHRVDSFDFDWPALGADLERHRHFPNGSNVSFVVVMAEAPGCHELEVRFWERGAGATLSSGTGSLGAAVAARHRGWIRDRATVRTEGGVMTVDWGQGVRLTGPARLIAEGGFVLEESLLR